MAEQISQIKVNDTTYDIAANNIYSTEEIPIGTWIDGKTIYRQVLYCSGTSVSATWKQMAYSENLLVCERLVNAAIITKEGTRPATYRGCDFNVRDGYICAFNTNNYGWGDGYIIVEYTKTTD